MKMLHVMIFAAAAVLLLYLLGGALNEQCVSLGSCRACWKTMPVTVNSTLCSKSPCIAQPAEQQNNALVDMYLCACEKAKQGNYNEPAFNAQIQESLFAFAGYNISTDTFCDQPGAVLAKRRYD